MTRGTPRIQQLTGSRAPIATIITLLASLRLCHVHLLWADEDYHLAAALGVLHGKTPYRDFWYDKPPLNALYYLLIGGYSGWPLRLLDIVYVLLACFLVFKLARTWWGETEARLASLLLAFFLTFYLPSAVVAFAADALMIVPHLAAIYCAFIHRPFLAGVFCAIAFLVNAKAVFVFTVCGLWLVGAWPALCIGFALPLVVAAGFAGLSGTWAGYWEQVWRWGWLYSRQSPVTDPVRIGFLRSVDWLGFHAALTGGATLELVAGNRSERWKIGSWLLLSFAAVCLGTRFAPHYFLQLLPPLVMAGSRGIVLAWRRYQVATAIFLAIALLVPSVRFGPRYLLLAYDNLRGRSPQWIDVAMDLDSQRAAATIRAAAQPGDSLFVWGYRPDIYVYTRLTSDGKFWDSQPLTGVPADRHLQARDAIYGGPAALNRLQLTRSKPTWLVDGLGLLNPSLRPSVYPELRVWLSKYRLVAKTKLCLIYRRKD